MPNWSMIPKRIVYNSLIANHLQRSEEKTEKRNKEMLEAYRKAAAERAALGIPALPLTAQQTADLVELLKNPPAGEGEFLVELLAHRVPPGVDDLSLIHI